MGGSHLLLPPLDALLWFVGCTVMALGIWFGPGRGAGMRGVGLLVGACVGGLACVCLDQSRGQTC